MGAAGQRRADDADVGHLVAAEVGLGDLEGDGLARGDDRVVEGGDGLVAVMARALGVERRGADGVLHHGVVGEEGQPASRSPAVHGGPRADPELAGASACLGHVVVPSLSADLGDHVVGEAAQAVDLRLQRLGVLLGA